MDELIQLVVSRSALLQMLTAIERCGWFGDIDAAEGCGISKEKCPRAARDALCGRELRTAIQAVEAQIRAIDPQCAALPENNTSRTQVQHDNNHSH